jgi:hypothetical protein
MTELHVRIRSARAQHLARRLAEREQCSIAETVEKALDAYEAQRARQEPAVMFYERLASSVDADVGLDGILGEGRCGHLGPTL